MAFVLAVILIAALPVAFAFPNNNQPFLSIKGIGNSTESDLYYAALDSAFGPTTTFSQWKTKYGFSGSNDVRAIYYNAGDLGFGREMHCRQSGLDVACYVVNHGLGAATPPAAAVNDAVANQHILPTVAMVYKNALAGQPNDVSFYIYAPDGTRLNSVALDGEGEKFTPQLCLPCHGGNYDGTTHSVSGANFLPFDTASFSYSAQAGYTLADQQEAFRQLNALVWGTNPTALITELIDGWYGDVNTPGNTPNPNFVAPGYAGDPGLYNNVVKPYCRTCHIAQGFNLGTPADVSAAQYAVFTGFYMPHSQLTSHNFWNSPAPAYLANDQGWSFRVTKTADTNDGTCDADCSLREAIIAANASADKSIITFNSNLDGQVIPLSLSGTDDTAALGDLDITQPLLILGNGANNTIISGGGIDRVFQIIGATTDVVIQGVTIRDGSVSGDGGGLYVSGGKVTLNSSILKNNAASSAGSGGGLINVGGIVEINDSTLGPGNTAAGGIGGGLYNYSGDLTLNNSTVTSNTASFGGALYNLATMTITQATLTQNYASTTGGGVRNQNVMTITNSIISGNDAAGSEKDCRTPGTPYTSLGYNLVGQNGVATGCSVIGTDIVLTGTIDTVLNTNLTGEQGSVTYHALIPGSPAIDAIPLGANCTLPSYDQRNLARPLDGNADNTAACDIGAREFNQVFVTSRFDLVANDGQCTLREAVNAANTGLPSGTLGGECTGSPDVINLAVAGPYDLTQGQLTILGAVTINGNGQIIRRTSGASRIFEVKSGGNLNLSNVTIRDGAQTGPLDDIASGGGIYINPGGVANIFNSAIISNSTVSWGGGIANLGTLNIANSTVSGNSALWDSGGINNRGTANLTNVTVSDNTSDADADGGGDGGGVGAFGGTTTIKNSLIARNFDTPGNLGASTSLSADEAAAAAQAGQGQSANVSAQAVANADVYVLVPVFLTSGDYNLIGNDTGSGGAFSGAHDQVGTSGSLLNPMLGALTGSPAYYPLLPGSPAIDQIPPASCVFISNLGNPLFRANSPVSTDQRGVIRPINPNCDIGSYESLDFIFLPLILR
jgi:CSLREA domain-containing protein